jgi:lipid-binding SYLF domain-containing protein
LRCGTVEHSLLFLHQEKPMQIRKWMKKFIPALSLALVFGWSASAWADQDAVKDAQQSLELFKKADPALGKALSATAGYAVFPTVSKAGVGVGGAGGKGVLFENGKATGKVTMSQVSVGAQLGGQQYSELILFENATTLNDFKKGNFALAAQVSAVAATEGASANARYTNGVKVLTIAKGGLMYEASVGGQKFTFTPFGQKVGLLAP